MINGQKSHIILKVKTIHFQRTIQRPVKYKIFKEIHIKNKTTSRYIPDAQAVYMVIEGSQQAAC